MFNCLFLIKIDLSCVMNMESLARPGGYDKNLSLKRRSQLLPYQEGKILYRTDSECHYLIARTAHMMHKSISKTLDTIIDRGLENLRAI